MAAYIEADSTARRCVTVATEGSTGSRVAVVADTSIKVDERVRDRLAQLARESGTTIRDLVADLAAARLTAAETAARYAAARDYIDEHLCPTGPLTGEELADARQFWDQLRTTQAARAAAPAPDGAPVPRGPSSSLAG